MTDDVQAAVEVWLGRDGTEGNRITLLARLASDPPFRRAVAAEIHLVGMLQTVRAGEPRWLRLENELAGADFGPRDIDRIEAAVMARVRTEPRPSFRPWGIGLLLAVGAAAAIGTVVFRDGPPTKQAAVDSSYWGVVAQSWPWAGWRFDRMANGTVPNVVPGRPALTVFGGVVAGPDGSAVFRPNDPVQALVADAAWTPPRATGYAVELWFRADSYQKSTLAALMEGLPGEEVHAMLAELGAETGEIWRQPYKVRGLDRWPPAESGGTNVFSTQAYRPNHWHHLIVQRDGSAVQVILDGVAAVSASESPPDTDPVRLILGRQRTRGNGQLRGRDARPFVGRLADVALYDHPLTADEIRSHLAAGSHRADE